jgi:Tfp pilus assembly protein PilZ
MARFDEQSRHGAHPGAADPDEVDLHARRKVLTWHRRVKRFSRRVWGSDTIEKMEGPRHERRRHFRGQARPGRVLSVRFRAGGHTAWIDAETLNIGVGGAFIVTKLVPAVGDPLTVELVLPTSEQKFTLPAAVRWTNHEGMGVQFVGVDVDILLELNDYFATLT